MHTTPMSHSERPVLIVFSGLPGTGKTTVSKALALRARAMYLRIDTIEQAMKDSGVEGIGPAGYAVANAVAEANLVLGHSVVADCVNPVSASRAGWRKVAEQASASLVDIHLFCSDAIEHKRRVEERVADIPGHVLPTWQAVAHHDFEPRDDDCLLLDTAKTSPLELVECCVAYVARTRVES